MKAVVRKTVLAITSALSAFFWAAYYLQYFKWRNCFNELGRCFDADTTTVYFEQSGAVWLSLALLTTVIAVSLFWRRGR